MGMLKVSLLEFFSTRQILPYDGITITSLIRRLGIDAWRKNCREHKLHQLDCTSNRSSSPDDAGPRHACFIALGREYCFQHSFMRPLPKAVFRIAVCVAAELAMVVVVQFQIIVVKDRPFTVALVGILAVWIVSVPGVVACVRDISADTGIGRYGEITSWRHEST